MWLGNTLQVHIVNADNERQGIENAGDDGQRLNHLFHPIADQGQKDVDQLSSASIGSITTLLNPSSGRACGVFDVHSIEEQHVEVPVEIERAGKSLNQRDRADAGRTA